MQKVDELLQLTKIEHLKHRYPKNLSGGEKQREMGITMVFVTHNLADVAEMGDRVVALNNGKIWLMPPEMFKKDGDKGNHIHQDCLHCVMDCYCKHAQ